MALALYQSETPEAIMEQRRFDRYQIKDKRCWTFKAAGRKLPVAWIKNLNASGLQLQIEQNRSYKVGDSFKIQLGLMGASFIDGTVQVRWAKVDPSQVNVCLMGLEFVDPSSRIMKLWSQRKASRFLASNKLAGRNFTEILRYRSPSDWVINGFWLGAVVFPFILGYCLAIS